MELTDKAKEARREYKRQWREKNREHLKEYHREWREENKGKINEYNRRYWEKIAQEGDTSNRNTKRNGTVTTVTAKTCPVCGAPITGRKKYCSVKCKQKAYRGKNH